MSQSKVNVSDKEDVPALADLLVSLSTAARCVGQRDIELRQTLRALLARETLDGVPRGEYARLAILLGFKRRNHAKSRASGDGDGERGFLRAVLLELVDLAAEGEGNEHLVEQVLAVVPLVPHYGSWRDLLLLGEGSFPVELDQSAPLCLSPLGRAVCNVFATQLRHDMELVIASEHLSENSRHVPSNACKYAPHEKRHTGNTTLKAGRERKKKDKKLLRDNRVEKCLADEVAALVLAKSGSNTQYNPCLRADYRKFLSKLKAILTRRGFVIEPLLCKRELKEINFYSACKGSLAKNRKCLEKDPEVMAKWRKAMMSSAKAVADIDSLQQAAANVFEENEVVKDANDRVSPLRVMKCVESFRESRRELEANAQALLEQVSTLETKAVDTSVLVSSVGVPVLTVVDSSACENSVEFISLVLAAYVTARSQGLPHVIVDGEVLSLPSLPPSTTPVSAGATATAASIRAEALAQRETECLSTSKFFEGVCCVANRLFNRDANVNVDGNDDVGPVVHNLNQVRRLTYLDRLKVNAEKALSLRPNDFDEKSALPVDLVYLTTCDMAKEVVDADSYRHLIETELQQSSSSSLRSFSLCRVSEVHLGAESDVPLILRRNTFNTNPGDLSLDLCLVMDLTGSMGSWMKDAKTHLVDIVRCLQKETKIGKIRVSYVGYRDWEDEGRLVTHDFVPIASAEATVIPLMAQQYPSGGDDTEEDVLIAFHAALTDLTWESELRIMLHLADAPAHGYGQRGAGDRFKDGRCPDQKAPHLSLQETLTRLADDKKVDLLFCRLDSYGDCTAKMEKMFSEVYGAGPGFGILSMNQGASRFKDAMLSTLSTSMLQALTPVDIDGLQSFSGGTASSLLRVINSSLRESVAAVTSILREDKVDETNGIDLEGADEEDEEEENGSHSSVALRVARNNFNRLMSDLDGDELQPLRLALGMTLKSSMRDEAAAVLLGAGVTVQDLIDMNYPAEYVQLLKEAGLKKMGQL